MIASTYSYAREHQSHFQFRFKQIKNKQLDKIGDIISIAQDPQGFMWFGGSQGLARFDGYEAKIFRRNDDVKGTLLSDYIEHLHIDHKGLLWVGTATGLSLYARDKEQFVSYLFDENDPHSLSHDLVTSLLQTDEQGLWVATNGGGLNYFNFDSQKFTHYRHNSLNKNTIASDKLITLLAGDDGTLWIGTFNSGLTHFNPKTEMFKHYTKTTANNSIASNDVRALAKDSHGNIWVASFLAGITKIDPEHQTFKRYSPVEGDNASLGSLHIWDVFNDAQGRLWIATDGGGLNFYNEKLDQFVAYKHKEHDDTSLRSSKVRRIYQDNEQRLWFGHFPIGVSLLDPSASAFHNYYYDPEDNNSLSHNGILSVLEDSKGMLWIGTEKGLNKINRSTGEIKRYFASAETGALKADPILSLLEDSKGRIWVGTWSGGVSRYSEHSDTFITYRHDPLNSASLSDDRVWALYEDSNKAIWLGTEYGGLNRYDEASDSFSHYNHQRTIPDSISSPWVKSIFEDSQGLFWVGTHLGLNLFDRDKHSFKHFMHDPQDVSSISTNAIWNIAEDANGVLWIGTDGGGLNQLDRERFIFKTYLEQDGLSSKIVTGIEFDSDNTMWIGTGNGINRYNHEKEEFVVYNKHDGLVGNSFNRPASFISKKNELMFGSTEGISLFFPEHLIRQQKEAPMVLTDFKLLNKTMSYGDEDSRFNESITQADEIILKSSDRVFSFSFASLDYLNSEKLQYAYQLVGFDNEWHYVGDRRMAIYTNLDAGDYTFKVKTLDDKQRFVGEGLSVKVSLMSPWWASWWAYTIYSIAGVLILAQLIFLRRQRRYIENERRVNERLRQVDKIKDSFMANTSHELRTPLYGIVGLAESLIDGVAGKLPDDANSNLAMIVSSGRRLTHLVNDILDFSKLKDHKLALSKHPVDIASLTNVVMTLCEPLVGDKPITLHNEIPEDLEPVMADEGRIQQVLYNLIGNAIKFSDLGRVRVVAEQSAGIMTVKVIDNGMGIDEHQLDHIFDSFEQLDVGDERAHSGTGLGLAIAQQLVSLHGGKVDVISRLNEGSMFSFTLPMSGTYEHQMLNDNAGEVKKIRALDMLESVGQTSESVLAPEPNQNYSTVSEGCLVVGKFHILIVDDEPINRQVIRNHLSLQHYRVSEAANGVDALEILENIDDIDMVLLDIMMPRLSGFDVCKTLRKQYSFHELPILFLTAKNLIADIEMGYSVGANDFLSKPIAKEELLSRVETHLELLESNRHLKNEIGNKQTQVETSPSDSEDVSKLEASGNQSNKAKAEKVSSFGFLLAGVGHEIINPVNMANGALQELEDELDTLQGLLKTSNEGELEHKLKSMEQQLSVIRYGNQSVKESIANLYSLSHMDSSDMQVMEIEDGLRGNIELVRHDYHKYLDIDYKLGTKAKVKGISSELNQVFMNIIINACQAIEYKMIKLNLTDKGRLDIESKVLNEQLHIMFTDTGCGMSKSCLRSLFEPFYTNKFSALGLGLSVANAIVKRHQGEIKVSSIEGEGAVFTVIIALAK